jgi:hypothetical protein
VRQLISSLNFMNKKKIFVPLAAVSVASLALLAGCGPQQPEANLQNLTVAMNAYLAKKGDLCLGKTQWPIDVPQREVGTRARNAVQMPVLEHAGLVSASAAKVEDAREGEQPTEIAVTRYVLTEEGKKYVHTRETQPDFCAARLTLDKVVGWEALKGQGRQGCEDSPRRRRHLHLQGQRRAVDRRRRRAEGLSDGRPRGARGRHDAAEAELQAHRRRMGARGRLSRWTRYFVFPPR